MCWNVGVPTFLSSSCINSPDCTGNPPRWNRLTFSKRHQPIPRWSSSDVREELFDFVCDYPQGRNQPFGTMVSNGAEWGNRWHVNVNRANPKEVQGGVTALLRFKSTNWYLAGVVLLCSRNSNIACLRAVLLFQSATKHVYVYLSDFNEFFLSLHFCYIPFLLINSISISKCLYWPERCSYCQSNSITMH